MSQFWKTKIIARGWSSRFGWASKVGLLLVGMWAAMLPIDRMLGQHFESGMQTLRGSDFPSHHSSNSFDPSGQGIQQQPAPSAERNSSEFDWISSSNRTGEDHRAFSESVARPVNTPGLPPPPWGTESTNQGTANAAQVSNLAPPPHFSSSVQPVTTIPVSVGNRIPTKIPQTPSAENSSVSSSFSWGELPHTLLGHIQHWLGRESTAEGGLAGLDLKRVIGSLAIVLGGYFALVFFVRSFTPASHQPLPAEVVQVLGRTPLSSKQTLQLVKLGNRILLLLESAEGIQPIAEISEAEEVEHLIDLCQHPRSRNRPRRGTKVKSPPQTLSSPSLSSSIPSMPNLNQTSPEVAETIQQSLANIVRSIEVASRKPSNRRVNSYEA